MHHDYRGKVLDRSAFGNTAEASVGFPKATRKRHGKLVVGCEAAGHTWPSCATRARGKGSSSGSAARTRRGSSGRRPTERQGRRRKDRGPARARRLSGAPPGRLGGRLAEGSHARRHCARARQGENLQQASRLLVKYDLRLRAAKIHSNKAPTRIRGTAFGNHAGNTNVRRLVKQIEFYNREIGLAEKEVLREAANSRLAPQARLPVGMTGIDACAAMLLAAETGGI